MLKILTETDGVSGCEGDVLRLIKREIEQYCDDIKIDNMGNMLCFKKGETGAKTVLLSAHMDEVGFIVTKITEEGFLKFESVGGIDTKILLSQKVRFKDIKGIISLKAVHLTEKEEREKVFREKDLFIDIGAKFKADAEKYVMVGDCFTFDSEYIEFGNMIKAKALDDRAGCAILADMLKKKTRVNLICAFVTREEVGLRGAAAAFDGIKVDYAVVVEGTTCNDLPGVSKERKVTESGGGAAISVMDSSSVANRELVEMLVKIADENNISHQFKASVRGGNDAGAICVANGGIKTASISVPCRYIHSPVSVMNKSDYTACCDLIGKFLEYAEEL